MWAYEPGVNRSAEATVLNGAVGLVGHHEELNAVKRGRLALRGVSASVLLLAEKATAGDADVVAAAQWEAVDTVHHACAEGFEYMAQL